MSAVVGREACTTGSAVAALKAAERPAQSDSKEPGIVLQRVPIDEIFGIEFDACHTKPAVRRRIRAKYEEVVAVLMNSVKERLGANNIEDVGMDGESELFKFLAEVFHKDLRASNTDRILLKQSISENRFNCYTSSVLMADVLTRMGKPIGFVVPFCHILVAGETHAFETKPREPKTVAFSLSQLSYRYSYFTKGGADLVLSVAHNSVADYHHRRGELEKALDASGEAIRRNDADAAPWLGRGLLLHQMGRDEEALEACGESLKRYSSLEAGLLMYRIKMALQVMRRQEPWRADPEALYEESLFINDNPV
jgi:tetratricopeptide (TPR) repeat protein